MIGLLYERIKVIYIDMTNQYSHDIEARFKSLLNRRFNLRELQAVCATHTYFPSSRPKQQIIYSLYQYFSSQEDEQHWLEVRRLPTHPDPIPEFARDLDQPQEEEQEEEDDITWYIDRTPSPVSVLEFELIHDRISTPRRLTYNDEIRQITTSESEGNNEFWISSTQSRTRDYINNDYDNNDDDDIIVSRSLNSAFDAVATAPQIKKYVIYLVLVPDEVEEGEEGEEDCAICYESIKCMDLVKLNCKHKFCGICIKETLKSHSKLSEPSCALCRKQMISFSVKNPEIYNLVSEHCNLVSEYCSL